MEYVLITGGTSGIGLELAKIFAHAGYGIAITSLNIERLHSIKKELEKEFNIKVFVYEQDMGKIGAAKQLYDRIHEDNLNISILVNNAGIGLVGSTHEIDFQCDEALMILNMSSIGAFQPGPYTSTYFASKAFVLSYIRAVRYEAKKKGVQKMLQDTLINSL
jgi:short-subunit dehydrogenase